jgi:hypothetical protein
MEMLARQGVVLEELGDHKSRIERFKKLIGFSRSLEPEPFQEEMERLIPGGRKPSE